MVELERRLHLILGSVLLAVSLFAASVTVPHAQATQPAAAVPLQDLLQAKAAATPTEQIRVIVQAKGHTSGLVQAAKDLGGRVTHEWSLINGFGVQIPAGQLWTLARQPGVRWISWDSGLQGNAKGSGGGGGNGGGSGTTVGPSCWGSLASVYPCAIRATAVWDAGIQGRGISIAIVDSGIDVSNAGALNDLANRVVQSVTFNSSAVYLADRYGHGTHVAGIAAGTGTMSGGKYIGIAPAASLLSLKFSADNGSAQESDLLSALQWAYDNQTRHNIRVLNLSANSGTAQSCSTSPLCAAVEKLWFSGVVVVVSAGNRGGSGNAVYFPPANDPFVITVGAADDKNSGDPADDVMAPWSSRGLTQDKTVKPDILAPGAHITSVRAGDATVLVAANKQNWVDDYYFRLGGTSMAAPVVTGAVALMLEQDPSLTPDQVKWIIMKTGRKWSGMRKSDPLILDAYAATMYSTANVPGLANVGALPSAGGVTGGSTDSNVYWLSSADW